MIPSLAVMMFSAFTVSAVSKEDLRHNIIYALTGSSLNTLVVVVVARCFGPGLPSRIVQNLLSGALYCSAGSE